MTEAELAHFLRLDLVGAREELSKLTFLADQDSDEGFSPVSLNVSQVLEKV